MEHDFDLFLGTYERYGPRPLGLYRADRDRHCYLIGQTGTGKSTLMHAMITQDIHQAEGVVLIDPHGSLADQVLASVPREREGDVIVVDPSDIERPIGLNPLFGSGTLSQVDRERKATRVHAALKGIYADSWGPELDRVLMAALLALMDAPELRPTLLSVLRLLDDEGYRMQLTPHLKNRAAFIYFTKTIENYRQSELAQKTASTSNKIFQMVASSQLANIFGQYRPSFDFRKVMDERKILIVRLSQGELGDIYTGLFGALITSELLQAAFERSLRKGHELAPSYLYIDEFQNVRTQAIDTALSEARKYQLNLILGHQFLHQLSQETRDAVFGNTGTTISFRISREDAEQLAAHHDAYNPQAYTGLSNGQVIASCLVGGIPQSPVIAKTTPLPVYSERRRERICNVSSYRYGRTRARVERAIDWELGIAN